MRSLLLDNYDSYAYNLFQLLSIVNEGERSTVVTRDVYWTVMCGRLTSHAHHHRGATRLH